MSKLKIPWIVASAVVVAIFLMVAGLSIGEDAALIYGPFGLFQREYGS